MNKTEHFMEIESGVVVSKFGASSRDDGDDQV
jgi:hypothetical protein